MRLIDGKKRKPNAIRLPCLMVAIKSALPGDLVLRYAKPVDQLLFATGINNPTSLGF